jgi:hypothetical protein
MKGVWMLYDWDNGYRLERISTELEPLVREVAQRGYGKVGWLPLDTTLKDACEAWESSEPFDFATLTVDWRDPAPRTSADVKDAMEQMAKAFGVELTDWQSRAVRYFLNDTVTEEKP